MKKTLKAYFTTAEEKHPTGLHGYKISKKIRAADGNVSGKKGSSLAFTTTKLKSNVVSMCFLPAS